MARVRSSALESEEDGPACVKKEDGLAPTTRPRARTGRRAWSRGPSGHPSPSEPENRRFGGSGFEGGHFLGEERLLFGHPAHQRPHARGPRSSPERSAASGRFSNAMLRSVTGSLEVGNREGGASGWRWPPRFSWKQRDDSDVPAYGLIERLRARVRDVNGKDETMSKRIHRSHLLAGKELSAC